MESRANYFLIGSFTLAAIFAGFGFLLWLAKAEVDQSYANYDILFESVAGLSHAGDVIVGIALIDLSLGQPQQKAKSGKDCGKRE